MIRVNKRNFHRLKKLFFLMLFTPVDGFSSSLCNISDIQKMVPEDTTISSASMTAEPVLHCRIEGHIITNNPGPNQVNFRVQLPEDNWSGRYYFIGLGGSAGYVPSESQVPFGNPLNAGFAVAGTDTGRQGDMLNWDFLAESEAKVVDHQHRAAHVTNVAAQKITRSYYGTDKIYRYMSGCSGGGRMTTEAIERHPEDFDGVIIGAPGGRSSATMMSFIYAAQQMNREPGAWVSPAKLAFTESKVLEACDDLDGATDNMIWDHRECQFDISSLQCTKDQTSECLTQPEITSINALLEGPQSPSGPIKVGFPISNMTTWAGFLGLTPPPWSPIRTMENMKQSSAGFVIASSIANVYFHPGFDVINDFDFNNQADIEAWWDNVKRVGFGAPYTAELKAYKQSGGKVILWNGVSDPCCIDTESEEYYQDVAKNVGGSEAVDEFMKFYRVPGMGHCGGGTGPADAPDKFLEAMISWVEDDIEPAAIVAHRGKEKAQLIFRNNDNKQLSGVLIPSPTGESRDFLLCPYPNKSVFSPEKSDSQNSVFDASNWSCRINN